MKEKIINYSIICVGTLSLGILLFAFIKYIFPVILPFVISWLVAGFTVKPAKKLSDGIKVPERIIRLMMSLFITLTAFTLVAFILWQMTNAVWRFLADLGEENRLYDFLSSVASMEIPILGDKIPQELTEKIGDAIGSAISSVFSALAGGVTSVVSAVPQVFFVLLVTIISLVYFALDYDRITRFIKSLLPNKAVSALSNFRDGIFSVIKKYTLSYSLILLITFVTIFTGFLLLGVEHAFVISILVAFLDILPVIGVGTVLIPWSIFEIAMGNKSLGIGLLVLFIANSIIRQFSEPKIVGKSLDLHPIVTLILLYVGYALFGVAGLILLPVLAVSIGVALKGDNSAKVT